ncbi:MAG: lipid A export permease/ATP-binding protein MsbA [Syntrophobacteraceae bacterium]|jgi:subfamily B ATP-binding cassette protein MsbA|nr:lipid A export permease/ATP-binding protein MsbA [Syntrophobacteraceae bacterium]
MELYKRLLLNASPYWRRIILAMISMLGVAGCTGATAYLIKPVLDDIFIKKDMAMLQILPFVLLVIFLVKGVCSWCSTYFMAYVGQKVIAEFRQQLYDHLQTLSLSFFDRTPSGVLMSRIINDVNVTQGAVSESLAGLIKELISIVVLIGVIFYRDWQLAIIAMVVLPFAFLPIVKFGRKLRVISRKNQESMGQISVTLHETLAGNRIVKAFGMEEYEKRRFARNNASYLSSALKSVKVRALSSPIMEFLGGLGIVAVISYGGYSVVRGVSTPGNFFSFLAAIIMLYEPVKKLTNMNNTIQQGMAAAERIYQILDTEPEIQDRPGADELVPPIETIRFSNVSFGYSEELILRNIDLKVKAGEVIALVGMSGAGKTTLVNLIPRFYEVSDGAITINALDIRDVTQASLRARIGMVTQQSILFNDTIYNNIAYGDIRKGEAEIVAAARAANAYDFIMKTPQGFDTRIGEQGVRLSGGQRQRICIARALLKDAPILILDEATSSLDSDSELEVQKALENLMAGRTTFVIAHRLSTIKNADRILAFANGRIVEEGHHHELFKANGEYRRLYELQFMHIDTDRASGVL